ncbi:Oxoglutarate/iron-dependent dioxygenase [Penicillium italicum]|uniref:Oxoglutarate/iron-dependent dioxygenase n=1 Tax=Penicillium italicum TaxID=40296 RepID=A0A0A2LDA6_PENIT|nr:Oxoglutarate/iron-dependent dioxygenase [Penicillium italicum]
MGSLSDSTGIETIDISSYLKSNNCQERKSVADELVNAIHKQGACGLVGHGLGIPALRKVLALSKSFFDLPLEEKKKVDHPNGIVPHRGYSSMGRESTLIYTKEELEKFSGELDANSKKPLDWKEHYDIGSDLNTVHSNRWISEETLPEFRATMNETLLLLEQLSMEMVNALLLGLEVEPVAADYFRGLHTGHDSGFRLLHYPSVPKSTIDRVALTWCPTHTDFTTFTFLIQDENQGLEIEDRTNPGTFIQASTEIEDRIWFTMGDFGELWTNGFLPASKHRVIIPPPRDGSEMTASRYSIPYFLNPRHDGILEPQSTGKPGTLPQGRFKTRSVKEHIEFRMKYQFKGKKNEEVQ